MNDKAFDPIVVGREIGMKKIIILFCAIGLVAMTSLWAIGSYLTAPVSHSIQAPPKELGAIPVLFDGVAGWFVPAADNANCVVLMHGIHADRTSMIERAVFLKRLGYSSLLFDFEAEGETPGEQITFGYRESDNARSAVQFLRQREGCKKIVAPGQSLGGAASVLGKEPLVVEGFVLEAVYPTINDAVANRLSAKLGVIGKFLSPLLIQQIPLRLHISLASLRPVDSIKNIQAPVLIIGGSKDSRTPLQETEWLYHNAPEPKELWIISGADHVDFYQYAGIQYEEKISAFLAKCFESKNQASAIN